MGCPRFSDTPTTELSESDRVERRGRHGGTANYTSRHATPRWRCVMTTARVPEVLLACVAMAGRAVLRAAVILPRFTWAPARGYAKKPVVKGKGKGVLKEDLKGPEICKDPAVLTTHAMGVNIYKTGPEVKLKDDSEYPEWLFQIDLGPLKTLQELNPEMPKSWKLAVVTLQNNHFCKSGLDHKM
uniref:Large ribosomal subunit protein mL54 n=1 Tax=Leptobrachium leishanense TaxID=445787 RepID=A0A8C5M1S1_9ANUR